MKVTPKGAVLALLICIALAVAAPAAYAETGATDTGSDTATTDTGTTDTGTDAGSADTGSDTGSDTDTDTGTDSGSNSGSDSGSNSGSDSGSSGSDSSSSCASPPCDSEPPCASPPCEPPQTCEDRGDCPPECIPAADEDENCDPLPKGEQEPPQPSPEARLPFTGPGDMILPGILALLALMTGMLLYMHATSRDVAVASANRARAVLRRMTGFLAVHNDVERDAESRDRDRR